MPDIVERVRARIESGSKDPGGFAARPPAPVATYASIAADEQTLCFRLPALLKRMYVEVGNGGWGPGYGLLGLTGGAKDDLGQTAVQCYGRVRQRLSRWVLPLRLIRSGWTQVQLGPDEPESRVTMPGLRVGARTRLGG